MRAHLAKASVEQSLDGKPSLAGSLRAPTPNCLRFLGTVRKGGKKAHGALAPRGNADELGFIISACWRSPWPCFAPYLVRVPSERMPSLSISLDAYSAADDDDRRRTRLRGAELLPEGEENGAGVR